ncbi:MAG: ChaB family protein [Nocardioidaceae bacterium]
MPKTSRSGRPKQTELPSTLQRSSRKAQATFSKAYDAALGQYHDEERAHQVAYSALKHTHEKVGDRWEAKEHSGPSDPQAEGERDTPPADGWRCRRERLERPPRRCRATPRRERSLEDEQVGAGRRDSEGERQRDAPLALAAFGKRTGGHPIQCRPMPGGTRHTPMR